jgi:two-component system, sensor histidine kinase and response regulator
MKKHMGICIEKYSRRSRPNLVVLSLFIAAFIFTHQPVLSQEDIRIGVLANRGIEQCYKEWNSTTEYLNEVIPGYTFRIIPLSFDEGVMISVTVKSSLAL